MRNRWLIECFPPGRKFAPRRSGFSARRFLFSALVFLWMVAGIGTASSAPCPPGTVPAPPPLSGCLVLAPCPAGTVPAPPPLSGCLVLTACPTGQTLQNGTCQPNSSPAPTTSVCPPFQSSDASGNCVCLNGSAPGANGFCPGPNICLLGGTCCPPGGETGTGTCCPQGQIPMSDGTCVPFNSTIAKIVANEGLCPPSEELQPDGTCLYSTDTPDTARPAQSPRLYRYRPTEVLCQGRPHAACPVSFRRQAACRRQPIAQAPCSTRALVARSGRRRSPTAVVSRSRHS